MWPFLHSYVAIPASAEAVSTDHIGVPFVYSLVNPAAGMDSGHLWDCSIVCPLVCAQQQLPRGVRRAAQTPLESSCQNWSNAS